MKSYKVRVTYETCSYVHVKAESRDAAVLKAKRKIQEWGDSAFDSTAKMESFKASPRE